MTTVWPPRSIATLRLYAQLRRAGVCTYLPLLLPPLGAPKIGRILT